MSINARATRAPDGGLILGAAWAVFVFLAYCIIALYKLYRKAAKPATADTQAERTGAPPTQPSQDASQVGLDARLCQTLPSVSPGDELRTIPVSVGHSGPSGHRVVRRVPRVCPLLSRAKADACCALLDVPYAAMQLDEQRLHPPELS